MKTDLSTFHLPDARTRRVPEPLPPRVPVGDPFRGSAGTIRWDQVMILGVTLWFSVLVLFPLGAMLWGIVEEGVSETLRSLGSPVARHAFYLTLLITVIAVVVNTFFGVILALVLARQRFAGKLLLNGVVDLPFSLSPVVAGFMFIILLGPHGWLGQWFEAGGIRIIFALPGMILATVFVTVPFVAREVVPVLQETGTDQEDAARTLGANGWQTFWKITVPSMRWGLGYGVCLTASRALGEFGAVLIVSGSIIGKTQTATSYIHQEATDFHYAGAFAASLVLAVVSFLMLVTMELMRKRISARMA
jgi:sulfate transport system permease protein